MMYLNFRARPAALTVYKLLGFSLVKVAAYSFAGQIHTDINLTCKISNIVVQARSNPSMFTHRYTTFVHRSMPGAKNCVYIYGGTSEIRTPWDLTKVSLFQRCP